MNPNNIFFNQVGRVRSGWRFLIFVIFYLALAIPVGKYIKNRLEILPTEFETVEILGLIFGNLSTFICAVFISWLCGKLLEDLPFRAFGTWFTKNWFKDLSFGLILGTLTILFAALISMIFGNLSFQPNEIATSNAILTTLGISLLVFIMGAASEEAIFRGYILQTLSRAKLIWFGIFITSVPFALGHMFNPNVSIFGLINTALAGIWFGIAYYKTRTLWLPFGLHLMWNWVQGAFLGIPVSGIKIITPNPILIPANISPTWLTGDQYGIEGGFACTIALIISTLVIWFLPNFKATDEMLALTNEEKPKTQNLV